MLHLISLISRYKILIRTMFFRFLIIFCAHWRHYPIIIIVVYPVLYYVQIKTHLKFHIKSPKPYNFNLITTSNAKRGKSLSDQCQENCIKISHLQVAVMWDAGLDHGGGTHTQPPYNSPLFIRPEASISTWSTGSIPRSEAEPTNDSRNSNSRVSWFVAVVWWGGHAILKARFYLSFISFNSVSFFFLCSVVLFT